MLGNLNKMKHLMDIRVGYYGERGTRVLSDLLYGMYKNTDPMLVEPLRSIFTVFLFFDCVS